MQALSVTVAIQPRAGDRITLNRVRIKSECLVSQCGSFLAIAASTVGSHANSRRILIAAFQFG
jgi:hypothetical protein